MKIVGMMRIKNESKWIAEVIESLEPLCELIFIMDDHSTDGTQDICRGFDSVVFFDSPFHGLDESRDKNWLYNQILKWYPNDGPEENKWPDWIACIDGDEVLAPGDHEVVLKACRETKALALSLRILYLWNSRNQVRLDGVYAKFARPSLFRVINPAFTFQTTPWNGNLHCSSIPQEFLGHSVACEGRLLHLGYMDRLRRLEKWEWYNKIDPENEAEDRYLHMIIGDVPDVPADTVRKWAGPLKLGEI